MSCGTVAEYLSGMVNRCKDDSKSLVGAWQFVNTGDKYLGELKLWSVGCRSSEAN